MRSTLRWTVMCVGASLFVATALPAAAQLGGLGGSGGPGSQRPPSQLRRSGESTPKSSSAEVEEWGRQLRGEDPAERLDAVKQLAASQDKGAVQYLVEATADSDPRVKLKAIDALGTMRASDATLVLVQVLYLRDSEPWLKQRVLVALGKIGDSRAARPIADYMARDSDRQTLGTAIFALGEIGDTQTLSDLQRVGSTSSDERLQQLSQDAIAKIKQKAINPEIQVKALREREGEEQQRPASASAGPPVAY